MKQRILLVALLTFSTDINSSEKQDDIYDTVKLEKLMQELLKLRELIINSFSDVKLLNEEMRDIERHMRGLELDIKCERQVALLKKRPILNGNS